MSSEEMNETTLNFLKAISEYKEEPVKPIVIKLTYDPETFIVDGLTFDETDKPWIEITREQYDKAIYARKWKVVDGKLEEIVKVRTIQLPLVKGDKWHTHESNMLIIGKDNGWTTR